MFFYVLLTLKSQEYKIYRVRVNKEKQTLLCLQRHTLHQ